MSLHLGGKIIHIAIRDCPLDDKGAWTEAQVDRSKVDDYRQHRGTKFTHTICQLPLDCEDKAYRLSKTPTVDAANKLVEYGNFGRHSRCYEIRRAFSSHWDRGHKEASPHGQCCVDLLKEYEESVLELNLLRVCREIHHEAALIPYASNTFSFYFGTYLDLLVSRVLNIQQRSAITSIQLDRLQTPCFSPRSDAIQMLKGLKQLAVTVKWNDLRYKRGGAYNFAKLPLTDVRVIVGDDVRRVGKRLLDPPPPRLRRREEARKIEHALMAGARTQENTN